MAKLVVTYVTKIGSDKKKRLNQFSVLYMSSSFRLLGVESRDFSKVRKKRC